MFDIISIMGAYIWNDLQTEINSYIIIAEFIHILKIARPKVFFKCILFVQAKEYQMSER